MSGESCRWKSLTHPCLGSETESQGPGYKSADGDSGARKQVRFGDVPLAQRVMKKQISPPIHSQSVRDDSGRDETAGEGSQELKVVPPPFKKVRQW